MRQNSCEDKKILSSAAPIKQTSFSEEAKKIAPLSCQERPTCVFLVCFFFLQGRRCGKPHIRKEKVEPKFGSQNEEGAGFGDKVRRT